MGHTHHTEDAQSLADCTVWLRKVVVTIVLTEVSLSYWKALDWFYVVVVAICNHFQSMSETHTRGGK